MRLQVNCVSQSERSWNLHKMNAFSSCGFLGTWATKSDYSCGKTRVGKRSEEHTFWSGVGLKSCADLRKHMYPRTHVEREGHASVHTQNPHWDSHIPHTCRDTGIAILRTSIWSTPVTYLKQRAGMCTGKEWMPSVAVACLVFSRLHHRTLTHITRHNNAVRARCPNEVKLYTPYLMGRLRGTTRGQECSAPYSVLRAVSKASSSWRKRAPKSYGLRSWVRSGM